MASEDTATATGGGDYMQSRPLAAVRVRIHNPAAHIGRAGLDLP